MKLHLSDGSEKSMRLDGATMGLKVEAITFYGGDFHQMMQWSGEELKERLGVLYTRFGPLEEEEQ